MVNRFEDLAPLIAPSGIARGSSVGFRQGVVESWNTTTGANTVRIGGTLFTDLPIVASSSEILLIQPGDAVGIEVVSGTSAFATMYIKGRISVPGTPDTIDAIRAALAAGTVVDSVAFTESTASTTYVDLSTPGPAVTATIGASGKCLVFLSCTLNPVASDGSDMSLAVSGATTRAADHVDTVPYGAQWGTNDQVAIQACNVTLLENLNPGSNTFTAKYRSAFGSNPSFFGNRTIVVMPF